MLLKASLEKWGTPEFSDVFKAELAQLPAAELPLQRALTASSSVADEPREAVLLSVEAFPAVLRVRAGLFYSGVIGGCSCADDPTPLDTQREYCELLFDIDRRSGAATVELLTD